MWKKIKIKYRLAIIIAIVSVIIAIANVFLMNETIRTIVSIAPVIVLALDCLGLIEDNMKMLKRLEHEADNVMNTRTALHELRFRFNRASDNHLFNKKEIVEAITEAIEEAEADGRN